MERHEEGLFSQLREKQANPLMHCLIFALKEDGR